MIPIEIILKPSKILASLLVISHLGAIACLQFISLPRWIAWLASIITLLNLAVTLKNKAFLSGAKAITKIKLSNTNKWLLISNTNQEVSAILLGESYISRLLIILRFQTEKQKRKISILILIDSTSLPALHKLRVALF